MTETLLVAGVDIKRWCLIGVRILLISASQQNSSLTPVFVHCSAEESHLHSAFCYFACCCCGSGCDLSSGRCCSICGSRPWRSCSCCCLSCWRRICSCCLCCS